LLDRRQRNIENQRTLKTLGRYSESPDEIIIQLVGDDYRCLGSAQEVSRENEQTKIWEALDQAAGIGVDENITSSKSRYLKHHRETWVEARREYPEAKFLEFSIKHERLDTPDFLERWKKRKDEFDLLLDEMRKGKAAVWEIHEKCIMLIFQTVAVSCGSGLDDLTGSLFWMSRFSKVSRN
jgi:hypothetical protein